MRTARSLIVWSLLTACAPPPKVAGYSREGAAPPATQVGAVAAPPATEEPPTSKPAAPGPVLSRPTVGAPGEGTPSTPAVASEQELGEPGGFALEAVSPRGSYVAYCQPVGTSAQKPLDQRLDERGSADGPVSLTLALGTERLDLDELLATDPTGRFVVTLESGVPLLRDTVEHRSFSLAAFALDLERDALPDHRSIAFSTDGRELALLTDSTEASATLAVLDLSAPDPAKAARTLALSTRPWRVSAEGKSFLVTTAAPGSKGPNWPVRSWSQPNLRCTRGTFDAFSRVSGPLRDPTLTHQLLLPGEKNVRAAPGFVLAVEGGWVRREDDGRLVVVQGKQQRQLASARCGGRILAADADTGWFLVSCEEYRPTKQSEPKPKATKKRAPPPKLRFPLFLLKPGVVRDLNADLMRFGVDVPQATGQRYAAVRVEQGLLLVDFVQGRAELLGPTDRVLLVTDQEAILSNGGKLVRYTGGQRQELGAIRALDPVVTFRAPSSSSDAVGSKAASPAAPAAAEIVAAFSVSSTMYLQRPDGATPTQGVTWEARVLPQPPLAITAGGALVPTETATSTRWARGGVGVTPLTR